PQTLVPAAAGLVLLPQCLLAIFWFPPAFRRYHRALMALGIETLILLTAFYLTRRARGTVRGNPDAEPRSGRVRNAILYYLLLIGFLSQSLLVLQLMLPAMSSDWQWLNVILTATLTLVSVMLLPMAYIAGTRKLDAKGKVLNDNQHWIGGILLQSRRSSHFVEKRIGIGFTLNMARPISWVL
ncbi:membrane protein, partial [Lacticaseibacillus rhamnosus MTCC 5462]